MYLLVAVVNTSMAGIECVVMGTVTKAVRVGLLAVVDTVKIPDSLLLVVVTVVMTGPWVGFQTARRDPTTVSSSLLITKDYSSQCHNDKEYND